MVVLTEGVLVGVAVVVLVVLTDGVLVGVTEGEGVGKEKNCNPNPQTNEESNVTKLNLKFLPDTCFNKFSSFSSPVVKVNSDPENSPSYSGVLWLW